MHFHMHSYLHKKIILVKTGCYRLLGFLGSHMVNIAIGEILLPLRTLLRIGSMIRLPGGTILSHVACQSTFETRTKCLTYLGGILLVPGYHMRNLLYIVPRLLHSWTSCLLLGTEHWISKMPRLKVGALHRELGMLVLELQMQNMHRCMTQERGSNKLIRL
jgi:hypothetical protein